jgi:hypothetical protein
MIVTRTRAFGIIVVFAQSEFNLVGSPLYGDRPQAPYRLGATGAWAFEADRPR